MKKPDKYSDATGALSRCSRIGWKSLLGACALMSLGATTAFAQSSPTEDDFQRQVVAENLDLPMEFEISQDGRVFIASKCGALYAWNIDNGTPTQTDTVPNVRCAFEDGLLSVALDPNFTQNNYIYFQYTSPGSITRVSRFTVNADNSLDHNSESILLQWITGDEAHGHMGGSMQFDTAGNLIITTGDNKAAGGYFQPSAQGTSGNTNDLRGKVLRITPTANGGFTIPAGNLFTGDALHRPEIYAMGFRNPFRLNVDPQTGCLYVGDIGPDASADSAEGPGGLDELNEICSSGNYGWPYIIGYNQPYAGFDPNNIVNNASDNTGATNLPSSTGAIWTVRHQATMAGPVYRYDESIESEFKLPPYYSGKLIFWDFNSSRFSVLDPASGSNPPVAEDFPLNTAGFQGAIDVELDPRTHQLYVLQWGSGCCDKEPYGGGALYRFDYVGDRDDGPLLPVVSAWASSETGGNLAMDAFDGDLDATRWESEASDPQWLKAELDQSSVISTIKIKWEGAYSARYVLEGSNDDVNWDMLAQELNGVGGTALHIIENTNAYRYVRLTSTQRGTGYGHSLFEMQMFGAEGDEPEQCEPTGFAYLNMPCKLDANFTNVPTLLSQTGVFSDTANMVPTQNLISFKPNTKLWSDRALKSRWISLPTGTQIGWDEKEFWEFPAGTVAVKHFELPLVGDDGAVTKRLETRLIVMQQNGKVYGLTYKWRADNSDADLLTTEVLEDIDVVDTNGNSWTQTWAYPSPTQCIDCHNAGSSQILGMSTRQLNSDYAYAGGSENQLVHFNNMNLFNPGFNNAQVDTFDRMVAIDDTSASLETRVKSYLDANCAHCHGTGNGGSQWDARFNTPLANMQVVSELTTGIRNYENYYGIADAEVVTPGAPHQSVLFIRDKSEDPDDRMPPIGRALEHTAYIDVLEQWINSLEGGQDTGVRLLSDGATAQASSVQDAFVADFATDGDPTTRWSSLAEDPQWLQIDLGGVYAIDSITLNWETAYGSAYTIEGSTDGVTWTEVLVNNNDQGGVEELSNLSGNYQYIRLTGTERGTQWGYSLFEVAVYGTDAVATEAGLLSLNKPASSSDIEGDMVAANAFDGDPATRWASEFADPQWLQVDLEKVSTLTAVNLSWEAAYGSSYTIEGSVDGSNWTVLASVSGGNGGSESLNVSGDYRYVRMVGTERGTEWGYSLFEMEVWGYGDVQAPTASVTIQSPSAGQALQAGQAVNLALSVSDANWFTAGGSVRYSVDGGLDTTTTSSTVNLGVLPAGAHSVTVVLLDGAGDTVGATRRVNFTVQAGETNDAELLSLNKSATSSEVEGPHVAGNAFDGDMNTRWSSEHTATHFLQVDLGASYAIGSLQIDWEPAYATAYTIEVSEDGSAWSPVYSTTSGAGGNETLEVSGVGRYVRLNATERATVYGYSIWEMRIYSEGDVAVDAGIDITAPFNNQAFIEGDAVNLSVAIDDADWFNNGGSYRYYLDGNGAVSVAQTGSVNLGVLSVGSHSVSVDLLDANNTVVGDGDAVQFVVNTDGGNNGGPTGSPEQLTPIDVTASSIVGTGVAANAIDGNEASRWESEQSDPQYLQLDMGELTYFTRILLDWEGAYANVYTIDVSDDGNTWTTVYSTDSGDGNVDDITLNGESGRYIRMHGTGRATGYGYSLFEVAVYGMAADPDLALVNILSPAAGASIAETDPVNLQVNITDSGWLANGGKYRYRLDGGAPVDVTNLNTVNLGNLATGRHTLQVTLVDASGAEVSIPRTREFSVNCGNDCPNVLVFSKTSGFRHGSIPAGIAMVEAIAADYGYGITASEDASLFSAANLAQYSTVVFMNTTGDIFTPAQKAAFQSYIENGGGFVGTHSAADTEHGWDWYTDTLMAGAEFIHHGDGIPYARVEIETVNDPLVDHIGSDWYLADEWYFWEGNPRGVGNVQVLANLDRGSYNSNYPVEDHPVVFKNTVGAGRAFYTAVGHVDENFSDPNMVEMIRKAIEWTSED
ncbi:discoidin domain-containing protein [Gilvimarinus agarilyticus]|uniref:discoidin domain-containing protein n=1 Tax=Gilvimarinus agarilyticus TaxID=679259 RepID=UPI0018DE3587|nr:discoidin domain-containing protein [Gilvimarinus agarilyticus]